MAEKERGKLQEYVRRNNEHKMRRHVETENTVHTDTITWDGVCGSSNIRRSSTKYVQHAPIGPFLFVVPGALRQLCHNQVQQHCWSCCGPGGPFAVDCSSTYFSADADAAADCGASRQEVACQSYQRGLEPKQAQAWWLFAVAEVAVSTYQFLKTVKGKC